VIRVPPKVAIALAVVAFLIFGIGWLVYYIGTREDDSSKKNLLKFVGITMVLIPICLFILVLPWWATLGFSILGATLSAFAALNVIPTEENVRPKAGIAASLFFLVFVVFTGNLGFLSACLLGLAFGLYFYIYAGKTSLTDEERFQNGFVGSLTFLPALSLTVIAGRSIALRGWF
jgi:hypothetical protein